jgi:DNA mismatch endonuclease Vsr
MTPERVLPVSHVTAGDVLRLAELKGLKPASESSSRSMRGNRSKNTEPETLLRTELRSRGLRYRTHASGLPGRPDLVFPSSSICRYRARWMRIKDVRDLGALLVPALRTPFRIQGGSL